MSGPGERRGHLDGIDVKHLRRAIELARLAREHGNHPLGSLLVKSGGGVLAAHENVVVTTQDETGHPELTLVRWAGRHLAPEARAAATVYTSCEHCPMCATATYWAGIGRIVFALGGAQFRELLPPGGPVSSGTLASCSRALRLHAAPSRRTRSSSMAGHTWRRM